MDNNRKVFWMDTEGGEPGDGAWFWVRLDEDGHEEGEAVGPFESAVEAGSDARHSIIREATSQGADHPHYPCPDDPDGLHHIGCGCEL